MRRLGTLCTFPISGLLRPRNSLCRIRPRFPRPFSTTPTTPTPSAPPTAEELTLPDDCTAEARENWTPHQWKLWDELSATEKLERDPQLFSSSMVDPEQQDSPHLMDNAWVLHPNEKHIGTVIWLHGIGEGRDEAKKIFTLMSPPGFRIVVPRAPLTPVTALEEQEHRTWFDLEQCVLAEEHDEDHRGIARSAKKVRELLDSEAKLIDSKCIVLAGFAQGGALAIHVGVQYPLPLAGILSHSGYVALPDDYPRIIVPSNRKTRVCAVHGRLDEVVPLDFAKSRYKVLDKAGMDVELRVEFDLSHHSSEQSLFEMQRWFEDAVAGRLTKFAKRVS